LPINRENNRERHFFRPFRADLLEIISLSINTMRVILPVIAEQGEFPPEQGADLPGTGSDPARNRERRFKRGVKSAVREWPFIGAVLTAFAMPLNRARHHGFK
jgi:hypothetical protein